MKSIEWEMIVKGILESSQMRFDVNDDDEILCKTEEDANCIADFLEVLGFGTMHTSFDEENKGAAYPWSVYPD